MKAGWTTKRVGDLSEVIAGQSPEGKFYNAEGRGLPFYQGKKDFGEKFIGEPRTWTTESTKLAREGDILMSVRAPVGPVNFATRQICIGRGLAAIRSTPEMDRDFLFYQLVHLQPEIAGKEGAVFASISKSEIENLQIAYTSLAEQRRVVGVLDEVFAGLASAKANAEKNLRNARVLFDSYLQSVFINRRDDWVQTTIGEVSTLKSGTTVSPAIETPNGDVPYLKVADLTFEGNEEAVTTSSRFLNREDIKERTLIPVGATIFPKRGGAILTNKKRITAVPICADLNIMAVIPSNRIDARLLYSYFLNIDMKELGTGSSIPQINNYDIAPLKISFPKSLSRQREIAARVNTISTETVRLARLYEQKLVVLAALKKSLLHQAFTGEL